MKPISTTLLLLLAFLSIAGNDTLITPTTISNVTVFFNGAEITRTKQVSLSVGKQKLLVSNLPQELYPQSLQVKGLKNSKILSVKHEINIDEIVKKKKEEKIIEENIDMQLYQIESLKDEYEIADIEEDFLLKNSTMKKSGNSSDLTNLKSTSEFYRTKLLSIRKEKLEIEKAIDKQKTKIEELYKELNKLIAEKRKPKSQVYIEIETNKASTEKLKISYYVPSAGWEPTYDFRVEEISKPLELVYNATIYQSTGENWEKVDLSLSSNNPNIGATSPELQPWILGQNRFKKTEVLRGSANTIKGRIFDQETQEAIPFANVMLKQGNQTVMVTTTDFDGLYTLKPILSGNYNIEVSYIGYSSGKRNGINLNFNKTEILDFGLSASTLQISEVIVSYKKPLLRREKDGVDRASLNAMAARSSSDFAKTTGNGLFSRDDGEGFLNSRGGRTSNEIVFVDGIKLIGSNSAPVETNLISNSIKNKITNMEYKIEVPYTILSDGEDYNLKIKSVEIPVDYEYHAYPGLESDAFLNAKITNWAGLNLFSGKTNIFYQGTFTDEAFLDVENAKDTMLISLGRDKSIYIDKALNKKLYEKSTFAGNVKETLTWDINIKNNKVIPIKIIVHDQYPISQRKSYVVELNNISDAEITRNKGYLDWEIELKPDQSKKLQFGIEIKYPKYSNINVN